MKFYIKYGLGGGFGGANWEEDRKGNRIVHEFKNKKDAERYAYQMAIEEYQSYEGLHGLRTIDDIIEEEGVDFDEAESIYNDEMESWLDYGVEEVKE